MNFAALCFEEVTHYYLRLTESYLEEKRDCDQLGQSIKQKLTGDGKISVYQKYTIFYRGIYNALTTDKYKHRKAFSWPFFCILALNIPFQIGRNHLHFIKN